MPFSQPGSLIPRIGDEHLVAAAWERFMEDRPLPVKGLRNVVFDSWQRCRTEAVNPASHCAPGLATENVRQLTEQNRDLCDVARPVLDGLREILRECGTLFMLSDPKGTILQLAGETRVRSVGEEINLAVGGHWNEEVIGTNAIGTAIATCAPVQIHASEHFCLDVKRWTCAAAPVLDPVSRCLLGVVNVSGVKETFHGHTLGLVMTAARQIEGELAHREAALQSQLLSRSLEYFGRYGSDGLVLCDHRGRIVRTSSNLQAALELHGIHQCLKVGVPLNGLNLNQPKSESRSQRPGWLKAEWMCPIKDQHGELGTLLVVPVTDRKLYSVSPPRPLNAVPKDDDAFAEIIGNSEVLQATRARARRMAALDLPVLLLGETGVGKEVFARALHRAGHRPDGPLVVVNCGAFTRELLASELFGYAEGAFTGARRSGLPGKFEQADGGTLFLDEIGEMPLDMQPHLLRVLQDGIVVRLGDTRDRRVSMRLIAATNRDLQKEVAQGRFREDLYHRLCVLSLPLPALRDRPGDIETIVEHLNRKLADKYGCAPKQLEASVLQAFHNYRWPGNIRELQNVFESTFALSEGPVIELAALPPAIAQALVPSNNGPAPDLSGGATGRLEDVEHKAILDAVGQSQGNMTAAARTLGISRSTLYVKLAAIRAHAGL